MTLLKNGGLEGFVTANGVNLGKTSIESSRKDMEQNVWSLGLIIWTVINSKVITPAYLRPSKHNFKTTNTMRRGEHSKSRNVVLTRVK